MHAVHTHRWQQNWMNMSKSLFHHRIHHTVLIALEGCQRIHLIRIHYTLYYTTLVVYINLVFRVSISNRTHTDTQGHTDKALTKLIKINKFANGFPNFDEVHKAYTVHTVRRSAVCTLQNVHLCIPCKSCMCVWVRNMRWIIPSFLWRNRNK